MESKYTVVHGRKVPMTDLTVAMFETEVWSRSPSESQTISSGMLSSFPLAKLVKYRAE